MFDSYRCQSNSSSRYTKYYAYEDKEIHYVSNYVSLTKLKEILLSTYYIQEYNIGSELVDIICKYQAFDIWSQQDSEKSARIKIVNSNDEL